jgi:cystathionine beta-lyase/cystathionine gamma-synthase
MSDSGCSAAGQLFSADRLVSPPSLAHDAPQRLQLALVAPSLGGVETLVTLPARTTHVGLTPAQRAAAGITDGLVRVSVGVEDTDDVLHDFKVALDAAAAEQLPPDAAAL